jgi:hypothetical protein
VAKALEAPLKQIAVNAGMEGGVVVERVRNLDGPNGASTPPPASTRTSVKAGIIDAAKVTRSALQNAASIAALFLTTEASSPTSPRRLLVRPCDATRGAPRGASRRARRRHPAGDGTRGHRYAARVTRGRTAKVLTTRWDGTGARRAPDELIVEEPMEIRLDGHLVTTTMRTPGHDFELAVGFCHGEGLLDGAPVRTCRYCGTGAAADTGFNVVTVETGGRAPVPRARLTASTAACGVCGTADVDALTARLRPRPARWPGRRSTSWPPSPTPCGASRRCSG